MVELLRAENLRTHFFPRNRVVKAVDGVSFSISEGEMVGLVGESGSGKSVTALSIMQLIQPPGRIVEGGVVFKGRDLLALRERDMQRVRGRQIAMVFQNPRSSLNPVLTVGQQLSRVHRVHNGGTPREAMARALEMMQLVRIGDPDRVLSRFPHQLSGGMCQRVMIGMALICGPSLLIADEPTTGLDVTVQNQILELLREIRVQTRAAQLLITHDLGVVAETCDRVIVMYGGQVAEIAPTVDLFQKPLHPYTAALLSSIPQVDSQVVVKAIPGNVPNPAYPPPGCRFHPRCDMRQEVCTVETPRVVRAGDHRQVACHLVGEPERAESESAAP